MNPELQMVVDRLELAERHALGWKVATVLALGLATVAVALPIVVKPSAAPDHGRFSVIEANRIQLRDVNGSVAAEMASEGGSVWLVVGRRSTGCAQIVVANGTAQLVMAQPNDRATVSLSGSGRPSLQLLNAPGRSGVTLRADSVLGGEIWLRDAQARPRFHAP